MAQCKDCIHFCVCSPYTAPNESYPEVDGCKCFRASADSEIFEEIENLSVNTVDDWGNSVQIISEIDYAELKKKYTED